jgi:hypothetical protein
VHSFSPESENENNAKGLNINRKTSVKGRGGIVVGDE